MILNKAQAQAVYSAMCALNNVGGRMCASVSNDGKTISVTEWDTGTVRVIRGMGGMNNCEEYGDQAEFAAAYGVAV